MSTNQSPRNTRPQASRRALTPRQRYEEKKRRLRNRRIRRTVLVVLEVLMVCVLAVGCYAVDLLNTMQRGTIDMNNLYVASFANDNENETNAKTAAQTESTEKKSADNTETEVKTEDASVLASDSESDTETAELISTEIATTAEETLDDVLSHQDLVNGYWNILIAGIDSRSGSGVLTSGNGNNSDVMIICSINAKTKDIKMASIYRDTLLKMYSKNTFDKANAQFSCGTVTDMLSMVNMNLDLQIQDVVLVNWMAVAEVINQLGGIYLDISEAEITPNESNPHLNNVLNGYITEIVDSTGIASSQITTAGYQWCDGVQALAYCRNRYTTNNDFERTERQREVIDKVLAQAKVAGLSNLISALRYALSNVYTTLTNEELMSLAMDVASYNIGDTIGFPLEYKSLDYALGVSEPVVPINLEKNVKELHQFLYGTDDYDTSDVVKDISNKIIAETGLE